MPYRSNYNKIAATAAVNPMTSHSELSIPAGVPPLLNLAEPGFAIGAVAAGSIEVDVYIVGGPAIGVSLGWEAIMEGPVTNPSPVHVSVFSSSHVEVTSASTPESLGVARACERVREPETVEAESVAIDNLKESKSFDIYIGWDSHLTLCLL